MARQIIAVDDLPGFGQPTASDVTQTTGDSVNGDKIVNRGRVILFLKNTAATPAVVTVVSGVASPITNNVAKTVTVTLDQDEAAVLGPFEAQAWNQTSGDDVNTIEVDTTGTAVVYEAIRLPARNATR